MSEHSHSYSDTTTYNDGHIHHYGGITSKEKSGISHYHSMENETTYNDGHDHSYSTKTGPAIMLPCGRHNHYYETRVKYEDGHIHYIRGFTSAD